MNEKSRCNYSLDTEPLLRHLLKNFERIKWFLEIAVPSGFIPEADTEMAKRCHEALLNCIFAIQESGSVQVVVNGQHTIAEWCVVEGDGKSNKVISFDKVIIFDSVPGFSEDNDEYTEVEE